MFSDNASDRDPDEGGDRVVSVAVLIGGLAAIVAAATIWLLFTDPVTVASVIDGGEVSPLVLRLVEVIFSALSSLLEYL